MGNKGRRNGGERGIRTLHTDVESMVCAAYVAAQTAHAAETAAARDKSATRTGAQWR